MSKRGEKTNLTSQVTKILKGREWPRKHRSAILILIQRICEVEKQRRSYICTENLVIDEICGELLGTLNCLLSDK